MEYLLLSFIAIAREGKRYKDLAIYNQPDCVGHGPLPDLENHCENQAKIFTMGFLQKQLLLLSQFCSAPFAQCIFDLLHGVLVQINPNPKSKAPTTKKATGTPTERMVMAVMAEAGCCWEPAMYPANPKAKPGIAPATPLPVLLIKELMDETADFRAVVQFVFDVVN